MDEGARRFRFLERLVEMESGRRSRVLARLEARDPELAAEFRIRLQLVEDPEASEGGMEILGLGDVLDEGSAPGPGTAVSSEREPLRHGSSGSGTVGDGGWLLKVGQGLAGHRIEEPLSRGGMGQVYRAVETDTGRSVALKLLSATEVTETLRTRFRKEIQALARLEHPRIARLYRHGFVETALGKRPWFTMELVQGQWVTEFAWAGKGVPTERRVELLRDIAEAAGFAHGQGIVHRDIKAPNVLVDGEGAVHLVDFGIAHLDEQSGPALTRTHDLVGTPESMSPEQLEGRPGLAGPPSDVYALGVLGYQLLARRRPFEMDDLGWIEFVRRVQDGQAPRLESVAPEVDRDLSTVIHKALQRDPRERYASGRVLAEDLTRWLRGEPIHARPPSRWKRVQWLLRRHPVRATVVSLVLLVLVAGGPLLMTWNSNRIRAAAWTRVQLEEQLEERVGRAFLALAEAGSNSEASKGAAAEFDELVAEPGAPVEAKIGQVLAWIVAGDAEHALGILDASGPHELGSVQIATRLRFEAQRASGLIPSSVREPEDIGHPRTPLEHWARGNSRLWRAYGTRDSKSFALAASDLLAALLAAPKPRALHYVEYARAIWRSGDVEASRSLAPILELHWPRSAVAAHSAGCCYLTCRQLPEAAAAFRRALELNPDFVEAEGMLANSLAMQGLLEEAIPHFRAVLDQAPDRPESHQNLGTALLNQGLHAESIALFRRAAELNPRWYLPHAHLANAYYYVGEPESGILAAQEALRLNPAHHEARITLATLMARQGRFEELLPYVEEGSRRVPHRDIMWFNHGLALREVGREEEAIAVLDQGVERFPKSAGLYALRGSARVGVGSFERALEDFGAAEEILGAPFDSTSEYWPWIVDAREFLPFEGQLDGILAGTFSPANGLESARCARLARALDAMAPAGAYFDRAVELDAGFGADPAIGWKYDAACSWSRLALESEAALDGEPDEQEVLSARALDRLRGGWGDLVESLDSGSLGKTQGRELLELWLGDADLDPLRPDSEGCLLAAELHADADELWWEIEQRLRALGP